MNPTRSISAVRWLGWQAVPWLPPTVTLGWSQDAGLGAPVSFPVLGLQFIFFQQQHKEIPAGGPKAGSRAGSWR